MAKAVTQEHIDAIIAKSEKMVLHRVHGKCTVISLKLPNGFVITESTGCCDPANYDEKIGEKIVLDRIANRLWELEGYVLQNVLAGYDPVHEASLAKRRETRRAKKVEMQEQSPTKVPDRVPDSGILMAPGSLPPPYEHPDGSGS